MRSLLASAALITLLGTPALAAPTLRPQALVSSELVTVGDLVDGAGALASKPLFRSPDLGESGTVPATDIVAAAAAVGLSGIDVQGVSEVSVTRPSREASLEDLAVAVAVRAGKTYGVDPRSIEVDLGAGAQPLRFAADAMGELEITSFTADPRTGRFDATFDVAGRRSGPGPMRLSGTALETVEAAVPVRPLARGDIIGASDVRVVRRPRAAAENAVAMADAIGMAARRALRQGEPMQADDLIRPQHVTRGSFVTLIYANDGVTLSLKAKALGAGAAGDLVPVQNIQSKRVVTGVVTGPSEVTVTGPATAIARR
ncbi:flagellar basal body P-ring formation chaperone FlgA [Hansschlegelia quercus]|uniref:Flagellar basal body P-ring formation protein FlgA n=1 Tax=Hansschlegelia quercus TaxID=2528245 RepID=A0A4Q9GPD1_9HYPH|nr:flagellar basal body P-ring formation chaperone FlgA [Hansschlegelia quercus]TBN55065.1 flagellar basal body P-ring formation protein FlgA [Hansschlegelia quercus]